MPSRKAVLYLRLPHSLRRQIVGLAASERRSLNMFAVTRLEEGLQHWLEDQRRKRAEDPVRSRTVSYPAINKELAAIKRELRAPLQPPPLPADLTAQERAMLGLEDADAAGDAPAEPEVSPALLDVVAQVQRLGLVQGKRADE